MDKMKTTSSVLKGKFEISGKGLGTSLDFKTKVRSQKYKKASYAIVNVSEKDLQKIIKEFEKNGNVPYEKKRPKHEPTSSCFHLAKQLAKCVMISDKLNQHNHGSYTEIPNIFNETLSQNNSAVVQDNVITELKDKEHE